MEFALQVVGLTQKHLSRHQVHVLVAFTDGTKSCEAYHVQPVLLI